MAGDRRGAPPAGRPPVLDAAPPPRRGVDHGGAGQPPPSRPGSDLARPADDRARLPARPEAPVPGRGCGQRPRRELGAGQRRKVRRRPRAAGSRGRLRRGQPRCGRAGERAGRPHLRRAPALWHLRRPSGLAGARRLDRRPGPRITAVPDGGRPSHASRRSPACTCTRTPCCSGSTASANCLAAAGGTPTSSSASRSRCASMRSGRRASSSGGSHSHRLDLW